MEEVNVVAMKCGPGQEKENGQECQFSTEKGEE
jgi:hypothetical protein